MKKNCLPLLAALLMAACSSHQRPEGVLPPDAMAAFLEEAYLLEGFYAIETQHRYDTLLPQVLAAYDSILLRHGVTRQEVERSFDYYSTHADEYRAIQDSVIARLDRLAVADSIAPARDELDMAF
ncbi:MAG: DUF4296 domain-containing protein [Bacteroidales bacterium]|nr:DUF4296 domain-containing protein [Bacteroidales bacterium]